MRLPDLRFYLIGLSMLATSGFALMLTPKLPPANKVAKFQLDTLIPQQFGDWKMDQTLTPIMVNPDVKAELATLYSQTLSRTYHNSRGEQVMLSIAYGSDQSHLTQVHRPEVCYSAQGFQIGKMRKEIINVAGMQLPVMKLVATEGQRQEPIIYWVKIGDTPVRGNLEQGFARLRYGLTGTVPSGLVFRVSAISADPRRSFSIQEQFVKDLLGSLSPEQRVELTGVAQ